MSLQIKDLGVGRLKEEIKRLGKLRVLVGVQGEAARAKHPNADVAVGLLAFWLHYGTVKMPARPWVDQGLAEIRDRAGVVARRAVADLIDRRAGDAVEALVPIGEMARDAVVAALDTSREWAKPLADSTIAAKGHDQPLLDTGTVRDSMSYTIRQGDKVLASGGVE